MLPPSHRRGNQKVGLRAATRLVLWMIKYRSHVWPADHWQKTACGNKEACASDSEKENGFVIRQSGTGVPDTKRGAHQSGNTHEPSAGRGLSRQESCILSNSQLSKD